MVKNQNLIIHPAGSYFQGIPVDPITKLSAIPYDVAGHLGFMKIDFLHLSMLDVFESKAEIRALSELEPDWSLLLDSSVVAKLFQLHRNADLLARIKPSSIMELADCVALIRPAKRILINEYLKDRVKTRIKLYEATGKGTFKKAHALSYALNIVVQLNLIKAGINTQKEFRDHRNRDSASDQFNNHTEICDADNSQPTRRSTNSFS